MKKQCVSCEARCGKQDRLRYVSKKSTRRQLRTKKKKKKDLARCSLAEKSRARARRRALAEFHYNAGLFYYGHRVFSLRLRGKINGKSVKCLNVHEAAAVAARGLTGHDTNNSDGGGEKLYATITAATAAFGRFLLRLTLCAPSVERLGESFSRGITFIISGTFEAFRYATAAAAAAAAAIVPTKLALKSYKTIPDGGAARVVVHGSSSSSSSNNGSSNVARKTRKTTRCSKKQAAFLELAKHEYGQTSDSWIRSALQLPCTNVLYARHGMRVHYTRLYIYMERCKQ
ncbi:unnamed protein product, partial [Trichogramma brassicae]